MHVSDAPFPCGDIALLLRVVKILTTDCNAPLVRFSQPGNAIEKRGFARARCAENNREAGERAKVDIQVKAPLRIRKALTDADFEFGGDWRRVRDRRLRRGSDSYFHGPTAHRRRFNPNRFRPYRFKP